MPSPLLAALGGGAAGAGASGAFGRGASSLFDFMDAPRSAVANALSSVGLMESKDTSLDPMVRAAPSLVGLGGLGMGLLAGAGAPVAIPLGIGLGALTQMVGEGLNPAMDAPNVETGNPLLDVLGSAAMDPMTWAGGFGLGSVAKGQVEGAANRAAAVGRLPGVQGLADDLAGQHPFVMQQGLGRKAAEASNELLPPGASSYGAAWGKMSPASKLDDNSALADLARNAEEAIPERSLSYNPYDYQGTYVGDGAGADLVPPMSQIAPGLDPFETGISPVEQLRRQNVAGMRLMAQRGEAPGPISSTPDLGNTIPGGGQPLPQLGSADIQPAGEATMEATNPAIIQAMMEQLGISRRELARRLSAADPAGKRWTESTLRTISPLNARGVEGGLLPFLT